jgi:hypothetical protein
MGWLDVMPIGSDYLVDAAANTIALRRSLKDFFRHDDCTAAFGATIVVRHAQRQRARAKNFASVIKKL